MSYCCSLLGALTISSALRTNSDGPSPAPDRQPSVRVPGAAPQNMVWRRISSPPPQQKQPSVIEIERAIGAGKFKDTNPSEEEKKNKTILDSLLTNARREDDTGVQKRLRETGEWFSNESENAARANGRRIVTVMFLMIIPLGFSLLVASRVITLPFSTPFLDDLLY